VSTVVSFHAHPDDEVLLTGGTLARAAHEGHRVVLVVATDGGAGLSGDALFRRPELARVRRTETRAAAAALGVARVEFLGYDDSGDDGDAPGDTFAHADRDAAAERLAAVLRDEAADVLTVYDSAGGYGHPDHRQVHRVGVRAAELAGTRVVLEATVDRKLLWRVGRLVQLLPGVPGDFGATRLRDGFVDPASITHRVDVRAYSDIKRTAMAAHATQTAGSDTSDARTLAIFLRLPRPVFRRAFGREWFVERGRPSGAPATDDIFDSLRVAA
jgi:LmbE family N-acetylglucosaminyl deacetylase